MSSEVTIYCRNTGTYHQFPTGTSLMEICRSLNIKLKYDIVAAKVNFKIEDLNFAVFKPKDIEFIDLSSSYGMRVYVRTLSMVLSMAITELYPDVNLHIEHPISKGYYCRLEGQETPISFEQIERIKTRMNEIIKSGIDIFTEEKQYAEAKKIFANRMHSDMSLFEAVNTPYFRYFRINDYIDFYSGVLLPNTGMLSLYDLIPYYEGMLLKVPDRENPIQLEEMKMMPKMYEIFQEFVSWNKIMGLDNIGDFNIASRNKLSFDLIKVAEALHEKKVSKIADMIVQKNEIPRLVLISGPSSSGKTTFSKRLAVQLMVIGYKPVSISMDSYFVNRENTPLDESGDYDYENLHSLDLTFFGQQMQQLLNGEEIEIPSYHFESGKRQFKGNFLKLERDTILIVEGIHALNPEILTMIPNHQKFKIYVSALTTISIDSHNWISTTDTRLLRRIIRDYRYRSYSAKDTIARWPSVRRGEEKWIFPYQEEADIMFNSALIFELAVLKKYVEPLLAEVPKNCDEYTEAHRLSKFLNFFAPIYDKEIPPTSLLREFLGGSSFKY